MRLQQIIEDEVAELMIDWLKECYPEDEGDIEELSTNELCSCINRYYDGGVEQFMRDFDNYQNTKGE